MIPYIALMFAFASGWVFAKIDGPKPAPREKHFLEIG
jgi:hypothetical protein